MNKPEIQTYVNNFRRRVARYLRPGIGLSCSIFPATTGGAVLVFHLGPNVENDDIYKPEATSLGLALSNIEQHAFAGNLEGVTFAGTNTILEPDKIIFIKDGSHDVWSDAAAAKDVLAILPSNQRGQK
jgi:hypothetical protein